LPILWRGRRLQNAGHLGDEGQPEEACEMSVASGEGNWSGSVDEALRWAQATATLGGGGPITVAELFVGALLAHPDDQGEVRQFLDHFELTARDVLPDDFQQVTVEGLRAAAATVTGQEPPTWDAAVSDVLATAGSLAGGPARLPHLLGALLQRSTALRQALQSGLDRFGYEVQQVTEEYVTQLQQLDLSTSQPAGAQIGDWLREHFPRSHASFATFSNDAVDATSDFVSVGVEADAFAYLIASKALVPPLAIGLFGNWGSGKSFLMAKIRTRVGQLTHLAQAAGAGEVQVWGNVAHIEFNAWQYVESNLWAALLDRIFASLSPRALEKLSEGRRAEAEAKLDVQQRELHTKKEQVSRLRADASEQAARVRDAEQVVRAKEEEAARDRDALIAGKLEDRADAQFMQALTIASPKILGEETADALDEARRLWTVALASPWRRTTFWTRRRIAHVAAAALLVPVLAFVVETVLSSALAGLLAGLAAVAPFAAALLRAGADFAERRRDELADAAAQVDADLAQGVQAAQQALEGATSALAHTRDALATAEQEAADTQAVVAQLTKERDETTAATRLADFVTGRRESRDYRRLLSVVTMVSQDLKDLADLTTEYNAASGHDPEGPPNRIVLYIDDLDRCPPDRVIDVLEAVHLLLSFELFVVVVAVDTRWLTSALHKGLPTLADARDSSGDQPTAVDYLEKIFQIPFWIDPLVEPARQRLLHGLLLRSLQQPQAVPGGRNGHAVSVGEREEEAVRMMLGRYGSWLDPQARQLSITTEELRFIESLATLIGDTPRKVKRFVNVCHLLLSMAPPLSGNDEPLSERMGACLMAAIHEGLPLLAQHIGSRASGPNTAVTTLRDALTDLTGPIEAQGQCLEAWLTRHNATLPAGSPPVESSPLARLTKRGDMIKRLRFEADAQTSVGVERPAPH
jgi:KAP family P-loop domain